MEGGDGGLLAKVALGFAHLADNTQAQELYLPDSLDRHPDLLAHLAKRVVLGVPHPRAQAEDVNGAVVQVGKLCLAEAVESHGR